MANFSLPFISCIILVSSSLATISGWRTLVGWSAEKFRISLPFSRTGSINTKYIVVDTFDNPTSCKWLRQILSMLPNSKIPIQRVLKEKKLQDTSCEAEYNFLSVTWDFHEVKPLLTFISYYFIWWSKNLRLNLYGK